MSQLTEFEAEIAARRISARAKEHEFVLLDDLLHQYRVRARGRAEERTKAALLEIEREDASLEEQIAEHLSAIEDLQGQRAALAPKLRPLQRELQRLAPQSTRVVHVSLRSVTPWKPPAGVLVRASSWRTFVERARAANVETSEVTINEMLAVVVSPVVDDATPTSQL